MTRSIRVAVLLILAGITACAQLGLLSPQSDEEKLTASVASVAAMRDMTTALLEARKISSDDAQHVQDQLRNARVGLDICRQMSKTNSAAANAKLTSIRTGLQALEAYLTAQQKGG